MIEPLISKRVKFSEDKQRMFILSVQKESGQSIKELAEYLSVSTRTISDWKREKYCMTLSSLEKMCTLACISYPEDIEILEPFWSVSKAGRIGGKALYQKYGRVAKSEKKRKEKWTEWWNEKGKQQTVELFTKPITVPKKSEILAEFIGIMIGDGGISQYHLSVTLDAQTDKKYVVFVSGLITDLFGVVPKLYYRKNSRAVDLRVSRKKLVLFCNSQGLPIGDKLKQGLSIPDWILKNPVYSRACVRGLIDTDGCFFTHRYFVKKKEYLYMKIDFTSRSVPLLSQVENILQNNGFYAKLSASRSCIRIESKEGVEKYIKIFGTNNPKHQEKINLRSRGRVV